jgi:hypothetical protein
MSQTEVLQALRKMTQAEKLEVIEVASRLLREDLIVPPKLDLAAAAAIMAPFYEAGSELAQWTDADAEDPTLCPIAITGYSKG